MKIKKQNHERPFLLKMDLQRFSDNPPADPPADPPPADPPKTDPKDKDPMIPKSRFDEINTNYKTVKEQLDTLMKEKEEAERKAKEQQGQFEELYKKADGDLSQLKSQYDQTDSRVKELEGVITNMLEAKLTSIPEQFHDLIPSNLTPEQKLDWISKAETKGLFGTKKNPEQPVGDPSNPPNPKTDLSKLSTFQKLQAGYGKK